MIRYALVCEAGHGFESWFDTSAGFDDLAHRGFVSCPSCGSAKVERAIMAPNVARRDQGGREIEAEKAPAAATSDDTVPVVLMSEKDVAMRAMVSALHEHVARNAEHVGARFADEAMKIHHGESEGRAIYGQATPVEARMLQEEGVAFLPLPEMPDRQN